MTTEQMAAMNEVRERAKAEGRKLTMAEVVEHADAIAQWFEDYEPASPGITYDYEIPEGMTVAQAAAILKARGVM